MTYKIVRAALLGTFIGLAGSMVIIAGMFIKKVYGAGVTALQASEVLSAFTGDTEDEAGTALSEIIRFHVKANSDSEEDIELKYEVRDELLKLLNEELSDCASMTDAEEIIDENLPKLAAAAREVIFANGYDYGVNVYMTYDEFPMRQYGELVLPAGSYRALRVDIGEAAGENFWCLLYPAICYTNDSGAVLSEQDGEEIRRALGDDEYEQLFVKKNVSRSRVKVRFKLFELCQDSLASLARQIRGSVR